jgi:hypothetical protein
VNTDTVFRRPGFALRLTASGTLTHRSDEDKRGDQGAVEFSYARYRGRRWFVSGTGRLESNESLGLVLRSLVGGLVGLRLVNTNRAQFEIAGGLVGNRKEGVDTGSTRNVEGLLGLKWSLLRIRASQDQRRCECPVLPGPQHLGSPAAAGQFRHQT